MQMIKNINLKHELALNFLNFKYSLIKLKFFYSSTCFIIYELIYDYFL